MFFRKQVDYRRVVFAWLPLAVAITIMCALIYVAVQQTLRQSANDPQIQLSQDSAAALAAGATPDSVVASSKIDITKSLAPFLILYDSRGKEEASSAELQGRPPALPQGVLRDSSAGRVNGLTGHKDDFNWLTWQPRPGVREAIVVTHFSGTNSGYVVAGRSLREIEKRESLLTTQVLMAWLAALILSLGTAWVVKSRR